MKQILLFIILAITVQSANAKEISVQKIDENTYKLTLSDREVLDIDVAQARLLEKAESICGTKNPVFGRYSFEGSETIEAKDTSDSNFRFEQVILCSSDLAKPESGADSKIKSNSEAEAIQDNIRNLSQQYIEDIAKGRFDAAYSYVADSLRAITSKSAWQSEKRKFQSQAGDPIDVVIAKITVYDNPQDAPEPGIYVAADFNNKFSNAPIHCGYLMWFKGESNRFQIIREESGLVTNEQLEQIPGEQLPIVKQKLKCVTP